jgi:hypothetical protein
MSVRLDQRVLRVLLFLAGLALTLEGCTPVRRASPIPSAWNTPSG